VLADPVSVQVQATVITGQVAYRATRRG
jgi:hypothetical protein